MLLRSDIVATVSLQLSAPHITASRCRIVMCPSTAAPHASTSWQNLFSERKRDEICDYWFGNSA